MIEYGIILDGDVTALLEGLTTKDRRRIASQVINRVARNARVEIARRVRQQVNLPAQYVGPGQKRLTVSGFATPGQLEATITARGRATSLSRFVTGPATVNKPGLTVQVAPGKTSFLKAAFLIRLPGAGGGTDALRSNIGLAVRLRPGERLSNKYSARQVSKGLYILYGPSVAQVFENNAGSGVKEDIIPDLAVDLEKEFIRLINVRRS